MRIINRCLLSFAVGALLLGSVSGCGDSGAVVHVGASAITKTTLEHWAAVELSADGHATTSHARQTQQALHLLIAAHQLLGEAASLNVAVSNTEVATQLEGFEWSKARHLTYEPAWQAATYEKLLGRPGESRADRLLLVKLDMLAAKVERKLLANAEHSLTQAEVASHYAAHKQRYVLPERRDLEVIGSYEKPVILKAKREVEAGVNFLEIAKRVSIDQEAPNGLELHLARGEEEPLYDAVVFPAKLGVLYGPYLQAFYYIFKVLKIKPARQIPLAGAEARIRHEIVTARRSQIVSEFQHELERRWAVRTNCQPAYVIAQCRQAAATASTGAPQ